MQKRQEIQQKSRLGLLLVNKQLITRPQLDEALRLQSQSDMRLGEILIDQGWITEKQLNKALKNQSRYRYAAAITALLLGPIQPFMASAATDETPVVSEQMVEQSAAQASRHTTFDRSNALADSDLSEVSGQGASTSYDQLLDIVNGNLEIDDQNLGQLDVLTKLFLPASDLLDADIEISGVRYAPGPRTKINSDGSIALSLPSHIDNISFKNVRVKGQTGNHFGDIAINNIDLSGVSTTIKIRS